ncbi:MAG: MoxR family ATPase [Planctomycetes bacterium]|nr:MoxR family ATPase [Planctomycetota bacterium]
MESASDPELLKQLGAAYRRIQDELGKVIVGQDEVKDQLLVALFARGHCIVTGVPGLAKTLLISSLSKCIGLSFNRIQFTPDMMPSDITGTEVLQQNVSTGQRDLVFIRGPVFANVILADEINRTPPKTQAALLESMQEFQVTIGGKRYPLQQPFFVFATQNPIEQEGTYPLPEAQLDRFMFNIKIGYPTEAEELEIVRRTTAGANVELKSVVSHEEITALQQLVRRVPISDHLIRYAMKLARFTRGTEKDAPGFLRETVAWGAGPRATQYLVLGAKARAALHGRPGVELDDIKWVAKPVLRHRVLLNFAAEAEGHTSDSLIERILTTVDPNKSEALTDGGLPKVLGS